MVVERGSIAVEPEIKVARLRNRWHAWLISKGKYWMRWPMLKVVTSADSVLRFFVGMKSLGDVAGLPLQSEFEREVVLLGGFGGGHNAKVR